MITVGRGVGFLLSFGFGILGGAGSVGVGVTGSDGAAKERFSGELAEARFHGYLPKVYLLE